MPLFRLNGRKRNKVSTVTTWPIFKTKLRNRYEVAERTLAFQFERPSDWTFRAGQFVDITLINPPETDAEGNVRAFSITSAPYQETLIVATRLRDTAFKRVLRVAPLETEVKIGRAVRGFYSSSQCCSPSGSVGWRDWDYSLPRHGPPGGQGRAAAPNFPVLLEPPTGGRSIPGRTSVS